MRKDFLISNIESIVHHLKGSQRSNTPVEIKELRLENKYLICQGCSKYRHKNLATQNGEQILHNGGMRYYIFRCSGRAKLAT